MKIYEIISTGETGIVNRLWVESPDKAEAVFVIFKTGNSQRIQLWEHTLPDGERLSPKTLCFYLHRAAGLDPIDIEGDFCGELIKEYDRSKESGRSSK